MAYPKKYDSDAILADWRAGLTTRELGQKYFPHLTSPTKKAATYLRLTFGLRVGDEPGRACCGRYRTYPPEEKALWRKLRPTMTVGQILDARRAAGVNLNYAAIFHHTADIAGPRGVAPWLTARERREIRTLYAESDWLIEDIAARFNRPVQTIRRHLGPRVAKVRRKRTPDEIFAPLSRIAPARAA